MGMSHINRSSEILEANEDEIRELKFRLNIALTLIDDLKEQKEHQWQLMEGYVSELEYDNARLREELKKTDRSF